MTTFADLFISQWPLLLAQFGETVTYTDASEDTHSVTAIVVPRQGTQPLDATWEELAKQAEVYIDADSVSDVTYTPRVDSITTAGGVTYIELDRPEGNGAIYRYVCERADVEGVQAYGRRY